MTISNETRDDVRPTALGGRVDLEALSRVVRRLTPIAVPLVVSVVTSLVAIVTQVQHAVVEARRAAAADNTVTDQKIKDKAEAGYQEARHAIEDLRTRMVLVELATRPVPTTKRGRPVRRAPAPVLRLLPNDLDQAAVLAAHRPAAAPPSPNPDAAP